MLKVFRYLTKKDYGFAFLALCFVLTQVWLDLTLPDYMSEITLLVQTSGSQINSILIAGGKMLLCALGSLAASICTAICASRISSNFSTNLRRKIFKKVQSFSMQEIGRFSTASLITRATNDVTHIQILIVMGLQMMVRAPITAVWGIYKISGKSWQWSTSTGIAVIVLLAVVGICISFAMPKMRMLQTLTDNINRVTRENLTGIRVVRAYNAEDYQESKFSKANDELTHANLFAHRVMAFIMPAIHLINSSLTLSIYWIGAMIINQAGIMDRAILFSDMVVFSTYAMQIVMSFINLVIVFIMLPRATVAAKRINEVLDIKLSIKNGTRTQGLPNKEGEIEFRNVSFRYPDNEADSNEYVISNISFTAHKGETVAFIGSTGCGKSTAINLIPRFYDVNEGEVLVDGVNVKEYTQHALRNKIGYVSQKAILFSGTVNSNVAYGDNGKNNFSQSAVAEAVETAQASEFVENMTDGYDGYIAQGGTNLSGGQKQRLSIARAICRQPEIFIFDDSFSALDYKTDRTLRQALDKECGDATRIIVAQRIGTIRDADKIIVLDEGRIAGMGRHDELMKHCEVYQQIALSQLSKEELA